LLGLSNGRRPGRKKMGDNLTAPIDQYLREADGPRTAQQVEAHLILRGLLWPEMVARHPGRLGGRLFRASKNGRLVVAGKTPDGRNLYTVRRDGDDP